MAWKDRGCQGVPCKGCKERHLHCHSECEKYVVWCKERDALKRKVYNSKEINNLIRDNESRRLRDIKLGHKGKGLGRRKNNG